MSLTLDRRTQSALDRITQSIESKGLEYQVIRVMYELWIYTRIDSKHNWDIEARLPL